MADLLRQPGQPGAATAGEAEAPSRRFPSILFNGTDPRGDRVSEEMPACFPDLNLDQLVEAITSSKPEYHLKPFYFTPLKDVDAILYRHEVLRDLEADALVQSIVTFAAGMNTMRAHLSQGASLDNPYQKERWLLEAIEVYIDAVDALHRDLLRFDLQSRGFLAFRAYLAAYVASPKCSRLRAWTKRLKHDLNQVCYCARIKGNSVEVRTYAQEKDYSEEVLQTFERFKQGVAADYRLKRLDEPRMNYVEERILEGVAKLYPETFAGLDQFCSLNTAYVDEAIERFDREIQFYVSYLEFCARLTAAGLPFCYPSLSTTSKDVMAADAYDLALGARLERDGEGRSIVPNDFHLEKGERIIVVSGPNQGGKTTFARMFGQLHWLGSLGLPVPAREARTHAFDELFTHFEKEETIENLRGKLQEELARIHAILEEATSDSIVILNEIFTSTTVADAVVLGKKIMERMVRRGLLCVCVTFLDELASLGPETVSMVSTVVPENPALRTYKILRRPADGLSYAIWIAEKHGLTYPLLKERLQS